MLGLNFGEWLGVIGLVAAVVTMPSIFQMIWGRPSIDFIFEKFGDGPKMVLGCRVLNPPVSNPILVWLRIRRDPAHISAAFTINSDTTGKRLADVTQPTFVTFTGQFKAIELPASSVAAANIGFAYLEPRGAFAVAGKQNQVIPLPPDSYNVPLVVWCGEKQFVVSKSFVVTAKPEDSYWVR